MNALAKKFFLTVILSHFFVSAYATAWTEAAGDSSWINPLNWTGGVPTPSSNVFFQNQTTGLVGVDTGYMINTIASLTFNSTLDTALDFLPLSAETLTVTGAITNNSNYAHTFHLPMFAGGSATWNGGTSGLTFANNTTIEVHHITLAGNLNFTGTNLNFYIMSSTNYGRFLGSGIANVSGVTINIFGPYNGVLGDVFDFTSGTFTGANIGILPTLTGGLSWDTSSFISTGVLTVVPEPTTMALVACGLGALVIFRNRRKVS